MRSDLAWSLAAAVALLVLQTGAASIADETTASVPAQPRPRVGLVLSGGGAKGGAHVGVLKVLEEQRVPIDCVAGTSMGALVGAGYAAGMPVEDLERFISDIDWTRVVGGVGRRLAEPIEQKRLEIAASTDVELGLRDSKIVTPSGLANTSSIDDLLRAYVARSRLVADFDRLPIPFRAVATDMVSGQMVVLDSGDLSTAMRASMAIPGAFAPVVGNGYVLADGGMVRNIPVDVARETCADIVIVVNLVEEPARPEKLVEATQLLARSMSVMLQANEDAQLQTLTPRDVRIDVPMGDIGTSDFLRVPDTIPLGEAAARAAVDQLALLSVPPAEYAAWRDRVTAAQDIETRVAEVRFEGLRWVSPEYLRGLTSIRPGDAVDTEALSRDALAMSSLDDLDSVAYRLDGDPASPTLVWLPQEASVGQDRLRPSLGLYAAGGGDLKFLLALQHVRHWLNGRGGQWRNQLQIGYESAWVTSLYQPFDVAQRYFVQPELFVSRSSEDLYFDGDRVATYRFSDLGGRIELGANLSRFAQLRLGYAMTRHESSVVTGAADFLPESGGHDAGFVFSALYDSRSATTLATDGVAALVEYSRSDVALGGDRNWDRMEAGLRAAAPFGRNLAWLSLAGGTDLGNPLPPDRAFSLGGPRTLPAYQYDELRVGRYWLAEASYMWHVADIAVLKEQAFYAGIGLQAAGLYDRVDQVEDGETYGASLFLAGPTPVGTFTIGVGAASNTWGFWLSLGRPVGKGSILDHGVFR
jgi:NTE family protein